MIRPLYSRLPSPISRLFIFIAVFSALASAESLSLSQALREALEKNPGYQASKNDVNFAIAAKDSALAGFLPTAAASAAYGKSWLDTHQQRTVGGSQDASGAQTTTKSAGVNADWTLFQGFSAPLNEKRLGLQLNLAKAGEAQSRQDLVSTVVLDYADLARQIRLYRALDTSAAISEERMRLMQVSLNVGSASRSDWLSVRVDRNADEAALRRQEATLQSARVALGAALGRDRAVNEDVDSVTLSDAPLDLQALLGDLPVNRPDLRAAEANAALAGVAAQQRAVNWLPKIDALAGYNYSLTNSDAGLVVENRTLGPNVALQLNFNLFNGEFPWQTYHRARIAQTSAEFRKQQATNAAEAEVMRDYSVFRGADSALTLEREALGYAQENLGLTFMRWKSGSISYLDARRAQDQYLSAFTLAENTAFEALNSRLELLRAAGRLESLVDSTSSK